MWATLSLGQQERKKRKCLCLFLFPLYSGSHLNGWPLRGCWCRIRNKGKGKGSVAPKSWANSSISPYFLYSLWSWPKTGAYASQHCCINIHGTPLIKRKRKIGSYGVHMNVLMQHAVLFLFSLLDGTLCPDLLFFFFSCRAACHEVKKKKGRETWWSLRSHTKWREALGPDHQGTAKGKCVSANHSMGRHHFLFVCSFPSARLLLYACALTAIPWISSYYFFIHMIGMAGALRVGEDKAVHSDSHTIPELTCMAISLQRIKRKLFTGHAWFRELSCRCTRTLFLFSFLRIQTMKVHAAKRCTTCSLDPRKKNSVSACAGDQIPDEYAHAYKLVRDLRVACCISMVMAL